VKAACSGSRWNVCDLGLLDRPGAWRTRIEVEEHGRSTVPVHRIDRIKLWQFWGNGRTYDDVVVQPSSAPTFATGVTTEWRGTCGAPPFVPLTASAEVDASQVLGADGSIGWLPRSARTTT